MQRDINPVKEFQVFQFLLSQFKTLQPKAVLASGVKLMGLGGVAGKLAGVPNRYNILRGEGAPPGSRRLQAIYQMEKFLASIGTKTITVSEYIRQQRIQQGLIKPENVCCVYDGTDVARLKQLPGRPGILRQQFGWGEETYIVGMVGRLVAGKRYDEFIDLMAPIIEQHAHVRGALIAEGENRDALQAQIDRMGLTDHIKITGFMADMPAVYADLDCSILLTDYEGCPNSVLESMAAGIPTLASDVCGVGEIFDNGINGFLVQNGDTATTREHVMKLIETPDFAISIAQSGAKTVETYFNLPTQIEALADVLLGKPFNAIQPEPMTQVMAEAL